MELLWVEVGTSGKWGDIDFLGIDWSWDYLDTILSVFNFNEPFVGVWFYVYLRDLSEIPATSIFSFFALLAILDIFYFHFHLLLATISFWRFFFLKIKHLSHSQVLQLWRVVTVMILYKIIDPEAELVSEDDVVLAKEKVFKGSFVFGIEIVFDDVVAMHFCD